MKNSTHKYFLRIGEVVIDLNQIEGLKNMEDFLNLSLFTSLFDDEKEMISTLEALGFQVDKDDTGEVEIVKRVGNKKTGYGIKPISTDILYKRASAFLSAGIIKKILYLNREYADMMDDLLETYFKSITTLTEILEDKLDRLKRDLDEAPVEFRSDIRSEINSRKNSLANFQSQKSNISTIINLVERNRNRIWSMSRIEAEEYVDRLDEFVDKEVFYFRGDKKTPNNRGLVRLAIRLWEVSKKYPDMDRYTTTKAHDKKKIEISRAIKACLENDKPLDTASFLIEQDDCMDYDPDDFMFLDEEDFIRNQRSNPTETERESYEDELANLEEKQGQFSDEGTHRKFS